jgi:hypothetical protein
MARGLLERQGAESAGGFESQIGRGWNETRAREQRA